MRSFAFLTWIAAMALPAAAQFTGDYSGRYRCRNQWTDIDVKLKDEGAGRASGWLKFGPDTRGFRPGQVYKGSYDLAGSYNASTGQVRLSPTRDWLGKVSPSQIQNVVGIDGRFDSDTGLLYGKTTSPTCPEIELTRKGSRVNNQQMSQVRERLRRANSPERSAQPIETPNFPEEPFQYVDSVLLAAEAGRAAFVDILPVERVNQMLLDEKWKCLGTNRLAWLSGKASAEGRHFGTKRYVLECRGVGCATVRYRIRLGGTMRHFGLSQPVPVMELYGTFMQYYNLKWELTDSSGSGRTAEVRIHQWTKDWGDNGPGCRFF